MVKYFCNTVSLVRGVAQFGSALGSGPRGREFKSRHSDQYIFYSVMKIISIYLFLINLFKY